MLRQLRPIALLACALSIVAGTRISAADDATDEYGLYMLATSPSCDRFPVVVFLDNDDMHRQIARVGAQAALTRGQRLQAVTRQLKSFRAAAHQEVEQFLTRRSSTPVASLWVVPAFAATLNRAQIDSLAALPGVARVVADVPVELVAPVELRASTGAAASHASHLDMLNVPYLWSLGITGAGRLICSFDTGVEETHPALLAKWRGNHAPLSASWFSTIAPTSLPYDKADHGSHTMGIMVGSEGADTVGVAPGAEWITAGVIDQGKSLSGTVSDILAAFQWALDPDGDPNTTDDVPDVILNSWGVPAALFGPCDATFFQAIDNVEAAGIVCIFAAGNEGPSAATLRNPASRAASAINSFSVGAVDNSRVVASFSSRGPGGCGLTAIKPELVAPGVSVRSCARDGGYKLMTGTSMAAPFIAGLVALCRQYNPDLTVQDIKSALLASCQDLGATGEDNAYGHGFPNAVQLLANLPAPGQPLLALASAAVLDDGIAFPGEEFDLQITLTNAPGNAEEVIGRLEAREPGVTITEDSATFYFGLGGTTAMANQAFRIRFDSDLYHGQQVHVDLILSAANGQVYDTLPLTLTVGIVPPGLAGDHQTSQLTFTVSDFGQYGLGTGSIYNAGGQGFRYNGGANLLHEAGVIVGRSSLQLSSSIRGADGAFKPSDFGPSASLDQGWSDADGALHRTARFDDEYADVTIPITISQESIDCGSDGDAAHVIMKYFLVNTSLTTVSDLYVGFFADFDLGVVETIGYDASLDMIHQRSTYAPFVGAVALGGLTSFHSLDNGGVKTGFDKARQFELISSGTAVDDGLAGDLMFLVSGGPWSIAPGDSVEVAIALVAADDLDQLRQRAQRARDQYLVPTGVDDQPAELPEAFELNQNYPNPFNPTTTIIFGLPVASDVTLEVFNLLGQRVNTLFAGRLAAGTHAFDWDGRDASGDAVASGVYFYRLTANGAALSRKMVLLR